MRRVRSAATARNGNGEGSRPVSGTRWCWATQERVVAELFGGDHQVERVLEQLARVDSAGEMTEKAQSKH